KHARWLARLASVNCWRHDPDQFDRLIADAPEAMEPRSREGEAVSDSEDVFLLVHLEPKCPGEHDAALSSGLVIIGLLTRRTAWLDHDTDHLHARYRIGRQQLLGHSLRTKGHGAARVGPHHDIIVRAVWHIKEPAHGHIQRRTDLTQRFDRGHARAA